MTYSDLNIEAILYGDPLGAIEAAKRIIGTGRADIEALVSIATNKELPVWSRVAAIYVLGFVLDDVSDTALIGILADRTDDQECREHAAEALAHTRLPNAILVMDSILNSPDESPKLQLWCVYALTEIGDNRAHQILRRFAETKPTGALGEELRSALRRLRFK